MLRRLDSLFLRLFVLMWATLVASHLVAFTWSVPLTMGERPGSGPSLLDRVEHGPALPSLPPGNPLTASPSARPGPGRAAGPGPQPPFAANAGGPGMGMAPGAHGPGPGRSPGLPARALWLDYALRALLIGCGAWLGARWLAAPMQRLTRAAHALPQGLEQGRPPAALDEDHGTLEVRETARVFNQMAQRLQRQFDQRSLHMAAVSHDLRTPLTRLRLRLERLSDDAVAQAAIADLREMDELIESSLAVMREQSGDTATAEVDLGALLQSLVDDLAEQGQAVSMDDGAPPVRVRAHTASLRRIVGNLVGNALRYGQRARVAMATQADQVSVTVDDNGPGIPPDRLEQVFEPWVRLEGVQRPGGNGLGLAIARDLALREGGSLTLTNRPEGGLRATLSLPVV